jgi:hypothetical protein
VNILTHYLVAQAVSVASVRISALHLVESTQAYQQTDSRLSERRDFKHGVDQLSGFHEITRLFLLLPMCMALYNHSINIS